MAVKELHPNLSSIKDVRKEAKAISRLSHPGIPYLFGICSDISFSGISGKSYTVQTALQSKCSTLTEPIWLELL